MKGAAAKRNYENKTINACCAERALPNELRCDRSADRSTRRKPNQTWPDDRSGPCSNVRSAHDAIGRHKRKKNPRLERIERDPSASLPAFHRPVSGRPGRAGAAALSGSERGRKSRALHDERFKFREENRESATTSVVRKMKISTSDLLISTVRFGGAR